MAGKNQVTLTFAADTKNLEKGFENVGKHTKDFKKQVDDSNDKVGRLGDAGGKTETTFLGVGAGISGVSTLLSGDAGPEDYAMAIADMGDSIEHTIAPVLGKIKDIGGTMASSAATFIAEQAKMLGAHMANAARMAVGWLIAMGPIALVILAIGAIIGILALLGVDFEDVVNVLKAGWDFILGAIKNVFNWVKTNWPLILAIITGPIGLAVLAIVKHKDKIVGAFKAAFQSVKDAATSAKNWIVDKFNAVVNFFSGLPGRVSSIFSSIGSAMGNALKRAWNSTIGGRGIHIPSVGVGPFRTPGLDLTIPRLHQGGVVPGAPGTETLAMLQAGERVSRAGAANAPGITIIVQGSIHSDRDLVKLVRDELVRGGFRGAF